MSPHTVRVHNSPQRYHGVKGPEMNLELVQSQKKLRTYTFVILMPFHRLQVKCNTNAGLVLRSNCGLAELLSQCLPVLIILDHWSPRFSTSAFRNEYRNLQIKFNTHGDPFQEIFILGPLTHQEKGGWL